MCVFGLKIRFFAGTKVLGVKMGSLREKMGK